MFVNASNNYQNCLLIDFRNLWKIGVFSVKFAPVFFMNHHRKKEC